MTTAVNPGSLPVTAPSVLAAKKGGHAFPWKALAPVLVALIIAAFPPPDGLAQHAWYFFAIFAGVIVGLMLEPLPGAAIGLIGVALVTVLAPYVLFGPPNSPRLASSPPTRDSPGHCPASRTRRSG